MSTTRTRWWHTEGDRILCDLCPRACALHEGQRGFCFVRQNVGGAMELTTYGRSTGFCVDPIEKKPLNHFLPGTPVLSFGTAGCNLGCKFCQNWSISKAREVELLSESAGPDQIAAAALSAGCRSVAFTYNDPVIWAEYAIDTALACRAAGLKTVAVTAGYIEPEARRDFFSVIDAANVDLKAFTEAFYKYLTYSKLEPILDTLRWLKQESDVWFEITNLVIPDENDSPDEIARMCDWIVTNLGVDVPVHFTAFHPDFRLRDRPRTPRETLVRAHGQALDAGIKYAYLGNVHDVQRQSTHCPSCGALLIERDWYELGVYRVVDGRCGQCSAVIPGVFESTRGEWGSKRVPLRFGADRQAVGQRGTEPATSLATPPRETVQPNDAPAATLGPKVDFDDREQATLVDFARSVVESAVRDDKQERSLPSELADAPTFGVFVTLRRVDRLRGCRGRWGGETPLVEILGTAARDAALHDSRFPSITPSETPLLNVEVSLMFAPHSIAMRGDRRAEEVEVGRHGLVIVHPNGRGLLLPQVASSAGWDARTFLAHVSRKAGLPPNAWLDDGARLMTFEARILQSPAPAVEFDAGALDSETLDQLAEAVDAYRSGSEVTPAELSAPLTRTTESEVGVCATTAAGRFIAAAGSNRSLWELARLDARSNGSVAQADAVRRIDLLWEPTPLTPTDDPSRHGSLNRSAFVARVGARWGLAVPREEVSRNALVDALAAVGLTPEQWRAGAEAKVTAFSVRRHSVSNARRQVSERPAAQAGRFYPADPATIDRQLADYFDTHVEREKTPYRAVLLPHAGWVFCGHIIGKTLAKTAVPELAIILCPRHTPYGPACSVSAADRWQLPGMTVPVDRIVRDRLVELTPQLSCEWDAHRSEHAVEVIVPFLRRANAALRIVPIVVGLRDYEETKPLAQALATVLRESSERVLLVVSSDMNHFATEAENRRLDFLAIESLGAGDARRLYDTVTEHRISMCGIMPAVTVLQALAMDGSPPEVELIDYANSAQVTGDTSRVVGYAGMAIR